jgi:hypothetical protein
MGLTVAVMNIRVLSDRKNFQIAGAQKQNQSLFSVLFSPPALLLRKVDLTLSCQAFKQDSPELSISPFVKQHFSANPR